MPEPLRDLKIQTLSQSGPKYEPGWEFATIDLNSGAGGECIYLGFKRSGTTPVTSLDAKAYNSAQYNPPSGWLWDPSDLNAGAGGKYIYLVWKTGESKPPIRNITFIVANLSSPPNIPGWVSIPQDLNQGAGGDYIWLYYTTGQQ